MFLASRYFSYIFGKNRFLQITNLHNDVYGPDLERPLQGPFTEHNVGGHQSRHVNLNSGTDDQLTRPEAWRILLGTCTEAHPSGAIGLVGPDYPPANTPLKGQAAYPYELHQKAVYYRGMTAKRPVNIRNIRITKHSYFRFNLILLYCSCNQQCNIYNFLN